MNKIKPKIRTPQSQVLFESLLIGSCFLMDDTLWIKDVDIEEQTATCLSDGAVERNLCGIWVIPVDVEITWKKSVIEID